MISTIIGLIIVIINIALFTKIWTLCNNVNFITEMLYNESMSLKKDFINEVEKLHDEIKDPDDLKKAINELADRYYEKQTLKVVNFKSMIPNFSWK